MAAIPQTHSTIITSVDIRGTCGTLVAYIVLENVIRNKGLVDARVFVRLEVSEGFLGNALMCSFLYTTRPSQLQSLRSERRNDERLLGAIAVGVVTGGGKRSTPFDSKFTG